MLDMCRLNQNVRFDWLTVEDHDLQTQSRYIYGPVHRLRTQIEFFATGIMLSTFCGSDILFCTSCDQRQWDQNFVLGSCMCIRMGLHLRQKTQ